MHSQPHYTEPLKIELLDILIDLLETHNIYDITHKYIIQEYFPLNKPADYKSKIYELTNLTMEHEDGIVFCSDSNEELSKDMSRVLNGFLIDSILYIGFQENDKTITISLDDGFIRIYC